MLLVEATESPEAILELVGPERAAAAMQLPRGSIEAILQARPAARRRFARRLRERLGLSCAAVAAAAALPDDAGLARAVRLFGVALRLTGEPRVLPRERRRELAREYGEEAVGFALPQRARLAPYEKALEEIVGADDEAADAELFVAALAAGENPVATAAALRLGLAPPASGKPVTDVFGAPIETLPAVAADALEASARAALDEPARPAHPDANHALESGAA
ncbi:MAG: hypothetical protein EA385_10740 [Salinarimonadaceae bacterium]|nr:MAG: hypothetical protein EA385_10740 [Salinarimonadaceae bacterium]